MSDTTAKPSFSIKNLVHRIGLPTIIIGGFWVLVLIAGIVNGISLKNMMSDSIYRFGRYGILVLAMVPSIQSGTGPNFALPIGLVAGLFAMVCSIEIGMTGFGFLIVALVIAIVLGAVLGFFYGKLMNAVKGSEMTIATYTGYSITYIFCLIWLVLPFTNSKMRWMLGSGLRETIGLDSIKASQLLDNFLSFNVFGVTIPTGMFLVFILACVIVWLFFRSKTGISITAGGKNPTFAKASGLNVNNGRVMANVLSTVLGAVGMIIYAQSFGFTQLYIMPLRMFFPAVACILIGGATAQRARVIHVIIGTLIYQGLMATVTPVASAVFSVPDLPEILRLIIQNGVILYALTQVKGGGKQ